MLYVSLVCATASFGEREGATHFIESENGAMTKRGNWGPPDVQLEKEQSLNPFDVMKGYTAALKGRRIQVVNRVSRHMGLHTSTPEASTQLPVSIIMCFVSCDNLSGKRCSIGTGL
jgi:hypothetical protein